MISSKDTQCSHPVKFDDRGDMTGLRGRERERRESDDAGDKAREIFVVPLSLRLMEDLTPA